MSYHVANFEKNWWHKSSDISFGNVGPPLGNNFSSDPKKDFWGNFTSANFFYLLCPIVLQSLKEILENLFKLILCTYGTQSVQFLTLTLTHRHTDTYRHTQTDRHTDTDTDTDTDTHTHTHTHTHIKERETTKKIGFWT